MTIYDIAKKAGVSASTVSRVVNGRPGVNAETKRRIQELLDECDYTPNETARGLVTQNNRLIGVLVSQIHNLHYARAAYTVEQELTKRGYHSIFLTTGGRKEDQVEAIRSMKQRFVTGAVLIGSTFQNETVRQAIVQYLPATPVAVVNGWMDLPNLCGIVTDERAGVREMVRRFVEKGHRRLAFVNLEETPSNSLKMRGFFEGLADAGLDGAPRVAQMHSGYENCGAELRDFLLANPDLDGVIFSDDLLACIGGKIFAAFGIPVPDRMIYAGVNNSPFGLIASPTISCIDNRLEQACLLAAQHLEQAMEGGATERRILLEPEIVERQSTGAADSGWTVI